MKVRVPPGGAVHPRLPLALLTALALLLAGCEGDDGSQGPPGPPGTGPEPERDIEPGEDAPGVVVTVLSVDGGSGPNGAFRAGDVLSFTYTLEMAAGATWPLSAFTPGGNFARALVSGPTFNYQRVLAEVTDVAASSTRNADGSYTYTFADPIPATYLPPLNDTASFGADDGELSGQPLLSGTYTLGVYFAWSYTVRGESLRDVGNATADFLFGSATTLAPREVVAQANCDRCHSELQAHGGLRRDVVLCLLCHTAGSEDRNTPGVAGGTPGASIDMAIMTHKIHNGAHLPSVLGVATNPDGSRDYSATPEPYRLLGFGDGIHDYSDVAFPVWPSLSDPMPRDAGYSALGAAEQEVEDAMRGGVVACHVCHGDPDGSGPLAAPAQGDVAYQQPTRNECGSCHDDVDWDLPYTANMQTMPPQPSDGTCNQCHPASGDPLAVMDGHRHPILDPSVNPGLRFEVQDVAEAGSADMDGTLDVGEKIAMTFTMTDDSGADVAPGDVSSISVAVSGPTDNLTLVQHVGVPTAALGGAQPFTLNVPTRVFAELVGTSTSGTLGEVFATEFTPHWDVAGAETEVLFRSATGAATTLAAPAPASRNFLDVADASGFARNDWIVLDEDDVMAETEYLLVQYVEGDRLWFGSSQQTDYPAGVVADHAAGASVDVVTLVPVAETDYTLDAALGTITEDVELGDGDVVVAYTTDLVIPAVYPSSLNDSPVLDDAWGEWSGKPVVDGTYMAAIWGYRDLSVTVASETTTYRGPSPSVAMDVRVGDATTIEPYDLIADPESCNACHQDLFFHGSGRRGFVSCIVCHGTAGSEDRPQYRAANAPATEGVEVRFRRMLHAIHMGSDLTNASSYELVGFGFGYPNNFSVHTYEDVAFPALPGATKHCTACHGEGNEAWTMPTAVPHPAEPGEPPRPWRNACGSCHDSAAAATHIDDQTTPAGVESCAVCHDETGDVAVPVAHETR